MDFGVKWNQKSVQVKYYHINGINLIFCTVYQTFTSQKSLSKVGHRAQIARLRGWTSLWNQPMMVKIYNSVSSLMNVLSARHHLMEFYLILFLYATISQWKVFVTWFKMYFMNRETITQMQSFQKILGCLNKDFSKINEK